jgi:hypothetical protein
VPLLAAAFMLLAGCGHEAPFGFTAATNGANGAGSDIRLTYNGDQDFWPTLTEDGSGVLYGFVNSEFSPASNLRQYGHRCMGSMPVTGGTRSWQYCDNAAALGDSLSSYAAYAVDSSGTLIYAEGAVSRGLSFGGGTVTLWLADTAHPFRRTALARLPITVGDSLISWIGQLTWTGPNTFLAVGQQFFPATHCDPPASRPACRPVLDSIFYGGTLIRGTISGSTATLTAVTGGAGATAFSLADNGASIIFTQRDNASLMKIPFAGGTPTAVAQVGPATGGQLLGVSCHPTTCVVGVGVVTLWAPANPGPGSDVSQIGPTTQIWSVSLTTGVSVPVLTRTGMLLSSPLLLPDGKSVIAQYGNTVGHLQTFPPSTPSDLHLYPGLLP